MPWTLEIHHIGLDSAGDSTIMVVRDEATNAIVRSILIDGGDENHAETVNTYAEAIGLYHFDIIVATHYDKDHLRGLRAFIAGAPGKVQGSIVFDQGEDGLLARYTTGPLDTAFDHRPRNRNNHFVDYLNAIAVHTGNDFPSGRLHPDLTLRRPTAYVLSSSADATQGYYGSGWLVGKEILWSTALCCDQFGRYDPAGTHRRNAAGQMVGNTLGSDWNDYGDPIGADGRSAIPRGAPQIRCIAANSQLITGPGLEAETASYDRKANLKSLAFLVTFNRFKYFIGGDLPYENEDRLIPYLNGFAPGTPEAASNRVLAFKASHHGANTSTSRYFVDRLLPRAAIISCGNDNTYGHPDNEVLNVLEGHSADGSVNYVGASTDRYYLTGYQTPPDHNYPNNRTTRGGELSATSGSGRTLVGPNNAAVLGDVVLTVNEAGSLQDPAGSAEDQELFTVRYWNFWRTDPQAMDIAGAAPAYQPGEATDSYSTNGGIYTP